MPDCLISITLPLLGDCEGTSPIQSMKWASGQGNIREAGAPSPRWVGGVDAGMFRKPPESLGPEGETRHHKLDPVFDPFSFSVFNSYFSLLFSSHPLPNLGRTPLLPYTLYLLD